MKRIIGLGCLAGVLLMAMTGCFSLINGDMKFQMGNYSGAIADFKAHLAEHPDSFQARYMLARSYLAAHQTTQAVDAFQKALELKPDDPEATIYLGLAHVSQGDYEKAIETWESFRNPDRPLVAKAVQKQLTLLKIMQSKKEAQKALANEKQLRTTRPAQNTYAVCSFADQNPHRDLKPFQKALAAMTISNLSQIKSIQVVERLRLQALLAEIARGQSGLIDRSTAPRAGHLLGVENLLVGTISQDIRADAALASTSRQRVIGTAALSVDRDEFFKLPGALAANIAKIKNIPLTAAEEKAVNNIHTRSIDAIVYYGQALVALDASDWESAQAYFDKALAADPQFKLAESGRDSCPGGRSRSVSAMLQMAPQQVQKAMAQTVEKAVSEQTAKDKAEEEALGGGSGGSGH